jgi:hypothetical protein
MVAARRRLANISFGVSLGVSLAVGVSGCMSVQSQLHPTDIAALEQIEDYGERNEAYNANAIYRHQDARGTRYVKGTRMGARPRSWQSLDLILRSDRNSAAALPEKKLRAARVLTGFLIASGVVLIGGIAASAREGLDLARINGTGAVLLGGGAATLGFGIATGIVYGQAKRGYEAAVPIYNDSLALRLGIADAEGDFRPPPGVLVDEEGFIILDQQELSVPQPRGRPQSPPAPAPAEPPIEGPAPAPAPASEAPEAGEPASAEDQPDPASAPAGGEGGDASPPGRASARLLGPARGL